MIYTISLNPALDKTLEVNGFMIDVVNRVTSLRIDAGGKGINVSKVLKVFNDSSVVLGFLGGSTGGQIEELLKQQNIEYDMQRIENASRTNLKIVDYKNKTNTDINEQGPMIDSDAIMQFESQLLDLVKPNDWVVLTGSIPPGVEVGIYAKWIALLKAKGVKTILDADGEAMALGIKSGPSIIKPNITELEQLTGHKLHGIEQQLSIARSLIKQYDIDMVLISLGADGLLLVTGDLAMKADGLVVDVKSTVGAGDSTVAALLHGLVNKMDLESIMALATATGAAMVETSGTQAPDLKRIEELLQRVRIRKIGGFDYVD